MVENLQYVTFNIIKMEYLQSFNEELFGIDLSKIKKAAFDYHATKDCRKVILTIDKALLSKVVNELKLLKVNIFEISLL